MTSKKRPEKSTPETDDQPKMFSTIAEALEYLNIAPNMFYRKMSVYNIETKKLPGSNADYIATADVLLLEQSIKDPGSIA